MVHKLIQRCQMRYTPGQKVFFTLFFAFAAIIFVINCRPDVPQESWSKQWGPLVPHQTFPGDCSICHVTEGWNTLRKDFSFDHKTQTGYPLEGAHAEAACLRCHNDRLWLTLIAAAAVAILTRTLRRSVWIVKDAIVRWTGRRQG
jgi:hypothetical protein